MPEVAEQDNKIDNTSNSSAQEEIIQPTDTPHIQVETATVEPAATEMTNTATETPTEMVDETSIESAAAETEITEVAAEKAEMVEESAEAVAETKELKSEEMVMEETGPTEAQQALLASLRVQSAAPAINNQTWLNTEPLAWDTLRGKVVIVEFWTYG